MNEKTVITADDITIEVSKDGIEVTSGGMPNDGGINPEKLDSMIAVLEFVLEQGYKSDDKIIPDDKLGLSWEFVIDKFNNLHIIDYNEFGKCCGDQYVNLVAAKEMVVKLKEISAMYRSK